MVTLPLVSESRSADHVVGGAPHGKSSCSSTYRVATNSVAASPWRSSAGTITSVKSAVPSSKVMTTPRRWSVVAPSRPVTGGVGPVAHPSAAPAVSSVMAASSESDAVVFGEVFELAVEHGGVEVDLRCRCRHRRGDR